MLSGVLVFTKINHSFIQIKNQKENTWLVLNHDNHKLTMALLH